MLYEDFKGNLLVRKAVFGDLVTCKTSLDNPRTLRRKKEMEMTFRLDITGLWLNYRAAVL